MLKSINKRGFTLVETLCSLGIFSIIFISMMSYELAYLNIKKRVAKTNENIFIVEAIKNNIIYNMTFEDIEHLKNTNKIFINREEMTNYKCSNSLIETFSEKINEEKPYVKLVFLKYEYNVYGLSLYLYKGKYNDVIELQCNFYKGRHK